MKVFIIASLTANGMIGKSSGHLSLDWTSREDKRLFVSLTKEAGIMVMGSSTFATIGKALPERRTIVYTSRPESITVPGIETTKESPKELVTRLASEGAQALAVCGGSAIYSLFIDAGVVDELYLTVEPVIFGQGIPLLKSSNDAKLSLIESRTLSEQTILLHYRIMHSK